MVVEDCTFGIKWYKLYFFLLDLALNLGDHSFANASILEMVTDGTKLLLYSMVPFNI